MENDDNQVARWRLGNHKLKRLFQYYFPAIRRHTISLLNAKVICAVEVAANHLQNNS